jgi:transcriptional regulator with XRE-family HTH domain
MLPNDLREARKALGLTQAGLAKALRLSEKNGGRSIRIWEAEGNTVPGPVQVAVYYMLKELRNGKRTGKLLENTSANTRI